jgi:hypothetical protein
MDNSMRNLDRIFKRRNYQGTSLFPGIFLIFIYLISQLILLLPYQPVFAQGEDTLTLQAPDTEQFPKISIPFKLPLSESGLNADLKTSEILIYENGDSLEPDTIKRERKGVYFTLAVNPGRQLDIRDSAGVSPYEKLRDDLISWVQSRSSLVEDRWSFVSDMGIEISNANNRNDWVDAVSSYQPNFRLLEPQLSSLETAINLTSERVVTFGVDKTLLYITPAPLADQIGGIKEAARQAISAGIQVNVWMVDDPYYLTNDQGGALIDMAKETGGNFFHFTGTETIPDVETYVTNLGYYFTLSYQSAIRETGTIPLRITISTPDGEINGESSPYYIEIKPPNPILISPPVVITRNQLSEESEDLLPSAQMIKIMVEFPDCHPRSIANSKLYVDGKVVDMRENDPYDVFVWDLTSISEPGQHDIQVEVEDSFGLSGKTIVTPVQINVVLAEIEEGLSSKQLGWILLGVLLVSALFILVPWLIRRYWQADHFKNMLPARQNEDNNSGVAIPTLVKDNRGVIAKLVPLINDPGCADSTFNLNQSRVYIGCDKEQADIVLDDPSLDDVQALFIHSNTDFWLNDLGSTYGTWVNYLKIGRQPVRIQSGDIVHFGDCGFRFTIVDKFTESQVTVSNYEPIL